MLHPRAIIQRSCDVVVHVQPLPLASLSNPRSFDVRTYIPLVRMYVRDFDSPFHGLSFFAPTRSKSFRTARMAARATRRLAALLIYSTLSRKIRRTRRFPLRRADRIDYRSSTPFPPFPCLAHPTNSRQKRGEIFVCLPVRFPLGAIY